MQIDITLGNSRSTLVIHHDLLREGREADLMARLSLVDGAVSDLAHRCGFRPSDDAFLERAKALLAAGGE